MPIIERLKLNTKIIKDLKNLCIINQNILCEREIMIKINKKEKDKLRDSLYKRDGKNVIIVE